MFLGTAQKCYPKVILPKKNSGTFPSAFGDCFRGFPLKSASPKKIRERSRVFLGTAPENFPKVSLPKKKRERSRVFWGAASEDFPQNPPPEKNSGTFLSVFGDWGKNLGTFPSVFGELRPKLGIFFQKTIGNVSNPKCCWRLLLRMSPEGAPPTKIRELHQKIGLPKKIELVVQVFLGPASLKRRDPHSKNK